MSNELFKQGKCFGVHGTESQLNDAELVDLLTAYRRRVAGNYKSISLVELDKLPMGKIWLSPKLDGELWFLIGWKGQTFLANPAGRVYHGSFPTLDQAPSLSEHTVIAGELHALVDGRRARVGDLASHCAGGEEAKLGEVCFSAFDLVWETGNSIHTPYPERLKRLEVILTPNTNLQIIEAEEVSGTHSIRSQYEERVQTGELEGFIIRLESGLIYKLKPAITIDAVVIGYTVKTDQPDLVRSILLGLAMEDGTVVILGGCGTLGTDGERQNLLTILNPLSTPSCIRQASDGGGLYQFVKPEVIVEIRVSDLQSDRSDGTTSSSLLIKYEENGWLSKGVTSSPKPIHPVMLRIRSDKSFTPSDVRFAQVADYLLQCERSDGAAELLPSSEVLRRQVWTKEAKGLKAVRKLLLWKTHKEQKDSSFPAYVVHWTDYSPSRSTPLEREVRLAPNHEEAGKIAEMLISENIKKGWNEIGEAP